MSVRSPNFPNLNLNFVRICSFDLSNIRFYVKALSLIRKLYFILGNFIFYMNYCDSSILKMRNQKSENHALDILPTSLFFFFLETLKQNVIYKRI